MKQVAGLFQEVQSLRQVLAQQHQRHAEEIQRWQDRIATLKPNNWDTGDSCSCKNFKLVGANYLQSSAVRLRLDMEAWMR